MSRVGGRAISIPKGVEIKKDGDKILVSGPKGKLELILLDCLNIIMENDIVKVSVADPEEKKQRALWGTYARLISNMIEGVTKGFEKKLELVGIGYKAQVNGDKLTLNIGFSHPVEFLIPQEIKAVVEKNIITVSGIDKQKVGEIAAQIRRLRKPEPYKGTGIKYVDEIIRRKAGKKAVATTAA